MSRDAEDAAASVAARRIALLLEYDGAGFAGSQLQANAVTVQGILEDAITRATGETARVSFAGRTDAGVHAWGQVASFLTSSHLDNATLQRALNAWLREDVAVRALAEAPADFDPRRDARRRHYRYVVDNGLVRPVLERGRAWYVAGMLDDAAMSAAARSVTGKRDFAAFASRLEDPAASTVRELACFSLKRAGDRLEFDLVANAFLPHQVRRMVGALVEVGKEKLTPAEYAALLDGPPAGAGPAAPPHGLYLMSVTYEPPLFAGVRFAAATLDSEEGVC